MSTYLVRQPIFEANTQDIKGYALLYKEDLSENAEGIVSNETVASMITNLFSTPESKWILDGKPAYITFTAQLIKENIAKLFSKDKLVIQIDDSILINNVLLDKLYELKKEGYVFALNEFIFNQRYLNLLDLVDIISIDLNHSDDKALNNIIQVCLGVNKKLMAVNVNTQADLERAKKFQFHMVQGSYFSKPIITETDNKLEYIQSSFFQLASQLTRESPDIDEIVAVISSDVAMTYRLLRLVNSAYYSMRTKVGTVKQAVIIMGLKQLRDWIYLLSFENGKSKKPAELVRLSFLRGEFCQSLAQDIEVLKPMSADCYLVGMFSTLDSLMDCSMKDILEELPLLDEIKEALLEHTGDMGALYQLMIAYEDGNWRHVTEYADQLDIPYNVITRKYFECVEKVTETWGSLMATGE